MPSDQACKAVEPWLIKVVTSDFSPSELQWLETMHKFCRFAPNEMETKIARNLTAFLDQAEILHFNNSSSSPQKVKRNLVKQLHRKRLTSPQCEMLAEKFAFENSPVAHATLVDNQDVA